MVDPEAAPSTVAAGKAAPITVKEGKAEILFSTQNEVFYNPVQELNRDLSVTAISTFFKHVHSTDPKVLRAAKKLNNDDNNTPVPKLKVLEALGATGLRSVRFSRELEGECGEITCNDMLDKAVEAIKRNIAHNKCENITPSLADACVLMCQGKNDYDVVDIDPYGTPVTFLDTAVESVRSGGLLCVTATDLAVLAGNHIQACYGKYGGMPLKRVYCHEFALRLLLSCIDSHANRHGRYIKPLFSYKADFYIRVFVQVIRSQGEVQKTSARRSYVYDCVGCHSFYLQKVGTHKAGTQQVVPGRGPPVGQNCKECGHEFYIGGPIWSDPIHDRTFVQGMSEHISDVGSYLGTCKRMQGILTIAKEELESVPLFYELSMLSKTVHTTCPPTEVFRSAILNAGYQVSLSHVCAKSVKTNAPPVVIWDIMRAWARKNNVKLREEKSVAGRLLRKENTIDVDFTHHKDATLNSEKMGVFRFGPNPEPNWGPKARAGKRKPNDKSQTDSEPPPKKKSETKDFKAFSCKKFEHNECDLGDKCRYSHNVKESAENVSESTENLAVAENVTN